ncbi:aminotransferase class I/II-fold pyridoxal phosphate-dependent enzyme [Allokutzneria sp. A3M-2-11 16]|uniref:aminotransferase class I/II-fold pyridoxal phosphate-dependent enzyme n=1 Tax=Allokutzneria sp. A3M-2-11 16 TaxID=2962043 RepID=UPI0020B73FCF|nr:aminotransferase class I/II-fold pyridoxal phosphate-dependent enzyme [Allokutzneria sp. A3M-2-11 16]MCP3804975.1 aminotransferase class I/II-fold pyridoxal phosphate-dependent enzyme [Allokutzneria sp. A3M-2-11 16]
MREYEAARAHENGRIRMSMAIGGAGPLSHRRWWRAGTVQDVAPPEILDLGPGYLDPSLLPVDLLRESYSVALAEFGSAALANGADRGALALRKALAVRAARADGVACEPDQVMITSGVSAALHLLATTLAGPGEVVLVDQVGYDHAKRVLADAGLRVREVPADGDGMDPAALDAAITAEGGRIAFAYLNPTFQNPTGLVMPVQRRKEIVEVAARHGLMLVEDCAYADLGLGPRRPPCSLGGLTRQRGVIRLGSFAKTLAAGLRLGWLIAEREVVDRLTGTGVVAAGGSLNHLASLAVAVLMRDGGYDSHLMWLRAQLVHRRDTLAEGLRDRFGDRFALAVPEGGFYLWIQSTVDDREEELVSSAMSHGVRVLAGSRFGPVERPSVRLTYALLPPGELVTAANRLELAWS